MNAMASEAAVTAEIKARLQNLEVSTTQDDVDNCSNRAGTSAWTEVGSVADSEDCEKKMKEAVARMDTADKALKVEEEIIRKLEIILMKKVNKQKAVDDEDYEQAILLKAEIQKLKDEMTHEEKEVSEKIQKQQAEKERLAHEIKVFHEKKRMSHETILTITPEMLDGQNLMIQLKHQTQVQYVFWKQSWAGWSDGKKRSESLVREFEWK